MTFLRDRRGAIAVMVAVASPFLLATAGVAIDTGIWYREAMRLQLAADAAAMGAARLLAAKTAATSDFQAAGLLEARAVTGGGQWIGTLATPISVSVAADWSQVTVTLNSTTAGYLTQSLHFKSPALIASATAGLRPSSACALALSPSASPGVQVDNMGSITATGCGIFSDSTSGQSIYLNSGTISGKSVGAVGGIAVSNSGSNTLSPSPGSSYSSPIANPFGSLTAPSAGSCSFNNASLTSSTGYNFTQSQNVFCGNTVIGGNGGTDTFAPGVYYVVNGYLFFNNATVTQATGVTFVLTGASPGGFYWSNYSNTTTMTAPTTGATAGILVWQTCPSSGSSGTNYFAGGSTLQISGAIYTPCGAVNMSNNVKIAPVSGGSDSLVANSIYVTGSASLAVTASGSNVSGGTQVVLTQ